VSGRTTVTTYAELLEVLDNLPVIMRERRRRLSLTGQAAADAAGISLRSWRIMEDGLLNDQLPFGHVKAVLRYLAT
jgi:hypothetical protein